MISSQALFHLYCMLGLCRGVVGVAAGLLLHGAGMAGYEDNCRNL